MSVNRGRSSARTLLILLVASDLAFIAGHVLNATVLHATNLLNTDVDGGYPEVFQYLKFFWIAILLVLTGARRRSVHYCAWALVFTYFLLDDALMLHEHVGASVSETLGFVPALGMRSADFGELIVSATAAAVLGIGLLVAYLRGSADFRKFSHDLVLLVGGLVFFGVGLDTIHVFFERFFLALLEDGGEMLMTSLIVWYAFLAQGHDEDAGFYLVGRLRAAFS